MQRGKRSQLLCKSRVSDQFRIVWLDYYSFDPGRPGYIFLKFHPVLTIAYVSLLRTLDFLARRAYRNGRTIRATVIPR